VAQQPEIKATPVAPLKQAEHMPVADLQAMLSAAGLVLASTDPEKHRAAQQAAANIVAAPRVPRERKPLPAASNEPLILVETRKPG
jgi:ribonuclease E